MIPNPKMSVIDDSEIPNEHDIQNGLSLSLDLGTIKSKKIKFRKIYKNINNKATNNKKSFFYYRNDIRYY